MAKQVTNMERGFVKNHEYALEREQVTLVCDDGSKYVFERATDEPSKDYRLARRERADGTVSTGNGRLPASVKESMDEITQRLAKYGIERGWSK